MPKLGLDRQILSGITKNHQAIVALERVFEDVGSNLPQAIEAAALAAAQAIAAANSAFAELLELRNSLEYLQGAPAPQPAPDEDDAAPALQVGSLAIQNDDAVDIIGGTIGLDAGVVGTPSFYLGGDTTTGLYRPGANQWGLSIAGANLVTYSATSAAFTQNVSTTKQLVSTVATGTAPLAVSSTTLVANLHAAVADDLGTASTYPSDATDLPSVITLANAIKANNIARKV
jgi:hypothetical protein